MILDVVSLRRAVLDGRQLKYRFFWGHRPRPDGIIDESCFSQWYAARFEVLGHRYASAEHFMMAEKARLFGDEETRSLILHSSDPDEAKSLGRRVRNFDQQVWDNERFDRVTVGNIAKFEQTSKLKRFLLATDHEILVEASPSDAIWGIGLAREDPRAKNPIEWPGLNLLGFALMRTRAVLRGELTAPAI